MYSQLMMRGQRNINPCTS